jgi:hypothetical protein
MGERMGRTRTVLYATCLTQVATQQSAQASVRIARRYMEKS